MGEILTDKDSLTFSRLALALANDYESVYYINTRNDHYVEYKATGEEKVLSELSRGDDFFGDTIVNCKKLIFPADQDRFLKVFSKENVLEAVKNGSSFTLDYRLMTDGEPCHYHLKTIRGTGADDGYIIIGVRNVDAQVKREQAEREAIEVYSHIAMALASRYEVIYYIDSRNYSFIEYSSSEQYAKLGVNKKGDNFFDSAQADIKEFVDPADCSRVLSELECERFIGNLNMNGTLTITYRQLLGGRLQYVSMLAVKPKHDPNHIVIGVINIDADKRRETAFREALGNAIEVANHDSLTSVRNKHAYTAMEEELNRKIMDGDVHDFAIAVFDINGLKEINDKLGHIAGDEFIKSACDMICKTFKHSPVFRIGGDEFTVILMGSDYKDRGVLMGQIDGMVKEHRRTRLVTVAGGVSCFDSRNDRCVRDVFERADTAMYENKKMFKASIS